LYGENATVTHRGLGPEKLSVGTTLNRDSIEGGSLMSRALITPTGVERKLQEDDLIVSKTDPTGRIIYVNQMFLKISDFTESEVLGQPHNLVRHPDTPRCIFKLMWETLQSGNEFFTYLCNLTKWGDHYWVFAHVTPTFDSHGTIIGFHSNRRAPDYHVLPTVIDLYKRLVDEERRHSDRRKGMLAAFDILQSTVQQKAKAYDEFVFSL
jgi:PAS domain S-box-containing protein